MNDVALIGELVGFASLIYGMYLFSTNDVPRMANWMARRELEVRAEMRNRYKGRKK